jgi:hypothetical protein
VACDAFDAAIRDCVSFAVSLARKNVDAAVALIDDRGNVAAIAGIALLSTPALAP